MSKVAVFTDIHGRLDELLRILRVLPDGCQLVFLGDYVDRGSQSCEVVELVKELHAKGAICLRGNHEDMMCANDGMWWINGGSATLASYTDPLTGEVNAGLMEEHCKWMESLPRVHEDDLRVYVHAAADPSVDLDKQAEAITQWFRYPKGYDEGYRGKMVVHGHTPGIFVGKERVCLDGGKVLTCGIFDETGLVELIPCN